MDIQLKKISPEEFDTFYNNFPGEKTFLQTSKYGVYRKKMGEDVFLYGIFKEDELGGIVLIQKVKARRGTFFHVPHGPVLKWEGNERMKIMKWFLGAYVELGREERCDFVRVSPLISSEEESALKEQIFYSAPVHLVNPEKTWVLDLQQSEEDILKNMKKSTRYEVRRIEKMGIKVKSGNAKEDLDIFWNLHEETVKRQKFVPFSRKSTEIELEVWGGGCRIFSAEVDGKYLSSSVILFDSHAGYYHQGASTYSKLPVAHATIWAAILEAKKRGCKEFNFWGVCSEDQKTHPWYGLSRFKRGFGGVEKNFLHAQDFPLTTKYWLNWGVEKWRKWRRGY